MTEDEMVEAAPRISAMMQTPGWQDYVKLVQQKIELTKDIAMEDEANKLEFHKGSIKGMIAAVLSAEDLMNEVRRTTGEKRDARKRALRHGVQFD